MKCLVCNAVEAKPQSQFCYFHPVGWDDKPETKTQENIAALLAAIAIILMMGLLMAMVYVARHWN